MRRTRIAQSSVLPPVADESASPLRDVSQGEACPTDSGFIADQDRANIAKTSTLPNYSAPRVTSHVAVEGSMQQTINELTALCTSLQMQHSETIARFEAQEVEINRLKARVKLLEDREGVASERSRDDVLIKGRNLDEGEATAERVSDDTKEIATVLTSMDAATVLSSGVAKVPTDSGSIPTAGPPAAEVPTGNNVVPTASPVFTTATMVTPYKRRKGKEVMIESETLKKQKVQEQIDAQIARELEEQLEREDQRMSKQIARDAKVTRIHVEEELQSMIDGLDKSNETVAKYQDNYAKVHKFQTQQRNPWSKKQNRDYYMAMIRGNLGWKVKDFKGMTFEEIEAKFTSVWKQIEDFIPMDSKEEAKRLKRKGLSLEQESTKKLKSSDEVPEKVKSPDEVPKEKVKEMMHLVPIEEVYVEALQVKHPIIDWKVHTEVIEFPLAEEVSTASEKSSHCKKKRDVTAKRIALLFWYTITYDLTAKAFFFTMGDNVFEVNVDLLHDDLSITPKYLDHHFTLPAPEKEIIKSSNIDFVELICEEFKYQTESRKNDQISKRPLSFHHVIKLDLILGNLKLIENLKKKELITQRSKGSSVTPQVHDELVFKSLNEGGGVTLEVLNEPSDHSSSLSSKSEFAIEDISSDEAEVIEKTDIEETADVVKDTEEQVNDEQVAKKQHENEELSADQRNNEPTGDAQADYLDNNPEITFNDVLKDPVEPEVPSLMDILVTQEKPTELRHPLVDIIVESRELKCRVNRREKKVHAMYNFNLPEAIDNFMKAHLKNVFPKYVLDFGKSKQRKQPKRALLTRAYERHLAHKALYDALSLSLSVDEDDIDLQILRFIDDLLFERQIMRSLEYYVGGRLNETDYRLRMRTI
uniref:Uncharacterized protein n=1 Tax=Tanacetum cinerariifolium TaxID=118510 RepID=A0A699I0Y0_TANCI|nr:hypothetical protein [Tanacetum cinerariifolium]